MRRSTTFLWELVHIFFEHEGLLSMNMEQLLLLASTVSLAPMKRSLCT